MLEFDLVIRTGFLGYMYGFRLFGISTLTLCPADGARKQTRDETGNHSDEPGRWMGVDPCWPRLTVVSTIIAVAVVGIGINVLMVHQDLAQFVRLSLFVFGFELFSLVVHEKRNCAALTLCWFQFSLQTGNPDETLTEFILNSCGVIPSLVTDLLTCEFRRIRSSNFSLQGRIPVYKRVLSHISLKIICLLIKNRFGHNCSDL